LKNPLGEKYATQLWAKSLEEMKLRNPRKSAAKQPPPESPVQGLHQPDDGIVCDDANGTEHRRSSRYGSRSPEPEQKARLATAAAEYHQESIMNNGADASMLESSSSRSVGSKPSLRSPAKFEGDGENGAARKSPVIGSSSYHSNLTFDSCLQRLQDVEAEKRELEQYVEYVTIESKVKLESSLEELKSGLDHRLNELSSRLQHLFHPDLSLARNKGRKISSDNNMHRKEFKPQESLLSKMLHYNDENYKTIFNIMIVILILWGCGLAFDDVMNKGLPNFDLLYWALVPDLGPFLRYWVTMLVACVICSLFLGHFAASARHKPGYYLALLAYISVQMGAFWGSTWIVTHPLPERFSMPLAIGFMAEQTRMSMKLHSYLREKITWKKYDGRLSAQPISSYYLPIIGWGIPSQRYLYSEMEKVILFLFVPTLVYRDSYPRMASIRWSFLFFRVLEVLGLIYFTFLIFRQSLPQFETMAAKPLTWTSFWRASFNCM
jgi:hypothetical protein